MFSNSRNLDQIIATHYNTQSAKTQDDNINKVNDNVDQIKVDFIIIPSSKSIEKRLAQTLMKSLLKKKIMIKGNNSTE